MLSPKTKMLLSKTAALSPNLAEGSGPVCLQTPPASRTSVVLRLSMSLVEPPVTRSTCIRKIQCLLIFQLNLTVSPSSVMKDPQACLNRPTIRSGRVSVVTWYIPLRLYLVTVFRASLLQGRPPVITNSPAVSMPQASLQ